MKSHDNTNEEKKIIPVGYQATKRDEWVGGRASSLPMMMRVSEIKSRASWSEGSQTTVRNWIARSKSGYPQFAFAGAGGRREGEPEIAINSDNPEILCLLTAWPSPHPQASYLYKPAASPSCKCKSFPFVKL